MNPVRKWHSVQVEYSQVEVRPGEFIQLAVNHGNGAFSIIELAVRADGTATLASDIASCPWDGARTGPVDSIGQIALPKEAAE